MMRVAKFADFSQAVVTVRLKPTGVCGHSKRAMSTATALAQPGGKEKKAPQVFGCGAGSIQFPAISQRSVLQ
jgi:hypothetical protein